MHDLKQASPLGKKASYIAHYDPSLLFPIPRNTKREEIGVGKSLPFYGADIWNAYELSWLNQRGQPVVMIATIRVPCETPRIFESKSLKLYLVSFSSSRFDSAEQVRQLMTQDLSAATGGDVEVTLRSLSEFNGCPLADLSGTCLDDMDLDIDCYQPAPELLQVGTELVSERLHSHLLKSNCLVTNQPDWGSVFIAYRGPQINHAGLLKYIISLREHNEFHEQCVERMFMHILQQCKPNELTLYARYTRRGGIDINPYRSTQQDVVITNERLVRQ